MRQTVRVVHIRDFIDRNCVIERTTICAGLTAGHFKILSIFALVKRSLVSTITEKEKGVAIAYGPISAHDKAILATGYG